MAIKTQPKETEFDCSIACLIEIRRLLNQLYDAWRGILFRDQLQNNLFIISTLDCVFSEASNKFTPDEVKKCVKYQSLINELMIKWGSDIYVPVLGSQERKMPNPDFYTSWNQIKAVTREYQLYLMQTMESHNMLQRNKAQVEGEL